MNLVDTEEDTKLLSYLSFNLKDELFAANVRGIYEILEVPPITKVPRSPEYLLGVINLRGDVLPIIDTRIKFKMEPTELTKETCIVVIEIVIEEESLVVGALVDSVLEVLEIHPDQIKPSPSIGSTYNPEFIEGIVNIEKDFVMLLNIGKVFSIEDAQLLSEVANEKVAV